MVLLERELTGLTPGVAQPSEYIYDPAVKRCHHSRVETPRAAQSYECWDEPVAKTGSHNRDCRYSRFGTSVEDG